MIATGAFQLECEHGLPFRLWPELYDGCGSLCLTPHRNVPRRDKILVETVFTDGFQTPLQGRNITAVPNYPYLDSGN